MQANQTKQKQQGFQQSDGERLASKLNDKNNQNQLVNTFFVIPQAKPILSKNIIDSSRPKVLIKQVDIFAQPNQLLSSNLSKQIYSLDKPHNSKVVNAKDETLSTIWQKYVLSQNYVIMYLKFYRQDISELQKKGFKKFKLQLLKICRNQTHLFSTYIVDLSFLSDVGTYLLRNLKTATFQQIIQTPFEGNFKFDSHFECGNLFAAFQKKVSTSEIKQFDLILQNDINSKGFSNWFYFNIRCKKKATLKLNIVNMQKNNSIFTEGMKITVFSSKRFQKQKLQWHRDGYSYAYYKNELRKNNENQQTYSTLSFCYDIKYDDDLIYIAANMPYSYSKMLKYIDSIQKVAKLNNNIYFKRQNAASSISSNACPILTLTWKRDKRRDSKRKKKKIFGVIARQHPCETVSSYVMQGFINSLVYLNSESAIQLLQNYIFKIIPMVNVDGVIYGNSRCDITGNDINRKWTRNPNQFIYPIISGIKSIFYRLVQQQYQIDYFIDLHGHSRKFGSFIYGCKTFDEIQSRQTAWVMSRLNSKILFEQCQFGLSQLKKETARGIMSDYVIGKKSMTLQTSFFGYKSITAKHWEIRDLQKIGATIIQAIYAQITKDPKLFNWQSIKQQLKQALQGNEKTNNKQNRRKNSQSSFGSDSDPSEDEMTAKQKAQHFLDPTVALKLGLNQIKVVRKQKRKQSPQQNKQQIQKKDKKQRIEKYEMILDGFKQKVQFLPQQQRSEILKPFKNATQENLLQKNSKQAKFIVRQSRSTTKILPFKFTQRQPKQEQQHNNRKSVELLLKRTQKLSIPDLPRVETKSNFWSNLKKQYEVLLTQRKLKNMF